jgi:nucleoid-associated protein YgaU
MRNTKLVLTVAFVLVLVLMAIVPDAALAAPMDWPHAPTAYGTMYGGYASYGQPSYGQPSYGSTYGGNNSYGQSYNNGYNNYSSKGMSYNGSACWYHVHWGDTLHRIAARYGTSTSYMAWLNHISNPDWIYAGQWLKVPCHY